MSGPDDETAVPSPPAPGPGDELLDAAWQRPRRTDRLTWLLVGVLVAALAFAGGVLVQKKHDAALAASLSGAARPGGTGTPVAIGTVTAIAGDTLTLTDVGGHVVTVTVSPTARVTGDGLGGPTPREAVSVEGTKAPDGHVTATAASSHGAGG